MTTEEAETTFRIERRRLPREDMWLHHIRLICVRGSDGKCVGCQRKIGKPDFEIKGSKGVDQVIPHD